MRRRLRALALVAAAAAIGWLGCPRAPVEPLSVQAGMLTATKVRLVQAPSFDEDGELMGKVEGRLEASRGRVDWQLVDLPERSGEVYVSVRHRGRDDSASFDIVAPDGEPMASATLGPKPPNSPVPTDLVQLTLEHASGRIFVRVFAVATGAPSTYEMDVFYTPDRVAVDAAPPCDPKNIDIDNPNCNDVNPWCDPNKPDFDNPQCCVLLYCEQNLCLAKVTDLHQDGVDTVGTLSQGGASGIRTFMTGDVEAVSSSGGKHTTVRGSLIVGEVAEQSARVYLRLPEGTDLTRINSAGVRLLPNVECVIRSRARG